MSRVAQKLRDNLDDVDLWEVYGDELQEQGDPRGEMIAWSVSLVRNPSGATAAEIRRWLVTHVSWADPVSQERLEAVREPLHRRNLANVDLAMGHVRDLELVIEGSDDEVCRWWAERFAKAAADPLLQFLPSARLHVLREGAAAAAFHAHRWPVRALTVWADDCSLPCPAATATACPQLRRLSIDGEVPSTTAITHDRLERIVWTFGHVYRPSTEPALGWLLGASLPALTDLVVDNRLSPALLNALTGRFGATVRAAPGRDRTRYTACLDEA